MASPRSRYHNVHCRGCGDIPLCRDRCRFSCVRFHRSTPAKDCLRSGCANYRRCRCYQRSRCGKVHFRPSVSRKGHDVEQVIQILADLGIHILCPLGHSLPYRRGHSSLWRLARCCQCTIRKLVYIWTKWYLLAFHKQRPIYRKLEKDGFDGREYLSLWYWGYHCKHILILVRSCCSMLMTMQMVLGLYSSSISIKANSGQSHASFSCANNFQSSGH